MGEEIAGSNNAIIEEWEKSYVPMINAEKQRLNVKHRRTRTPKKSKAKNFKQQGEIRKIGISMSKGEVMTHKGKGKYPQNRIAKEWFNPITKEQTEILADRLAENTGDILGGHIYIR